MINIIFLGLINLLSPSQSDNNKHYRAAIIGCGRIGFLFDTDKKRKIISSHSGAYYNHPKTKLISLKVCHHHNVSLEDIDSISEAIKNVVNYYTNNNI